MSELTDAQWNRVYDWACVLMYRAESPEPYEGQPGWESAWDEALRIVEQEDREEAENR